MPPKGIIDLHCDTLTRCLKQEKAAFNSLNEPSFQLALDKMPADVRWAQCFAIFIPDQYRGEEAVAFFDRYTESFDRQMALFSDRILPCRSFSDLENAFSRGKFAAILTVEGGCVLAGDLKRVETIRRAGVRMVTLTWNGPNEIGSGNVTQEGLTAFGRQAVREMEEAGVLIDVSHLNDAGMADLLDTAKKPFVASHSNARSVCGHLRNLTDDHIREMAARKCLIGLNYYRDFLSDTGRGDLQDLWRHVCRFGELGALHCLALGSDYDGADIHPDLDSVEKSLRIGDDLVSRGLSREEADGIMFGNACRFFRQNLR